MRFLLLQARNPEDPIKTEERRQFAARMGVKEAAIVPFDLLKGPPRPSDLAGFDALLVGGSGEYDVSKRNLPWLDETLGFLAWVADEGFPTFASCFGFHLFVAALGGTVIRDEAAAEVGAARVCLTEAGKRDALFARMPPCFWVQAGHKDRAERFPEDALNLAYSDLVPYQALRVPGKPIWATQFHPELTARDTFERFRRYADVYAPGLSDEEIWAKLKESPEAETLLRRFVELIRAGA